MSRSVRNKVCYTCTTGTTGTGAPGFLNVSKWMIHKTKNTTNTRCLTTSVWRRSVCVLIPSEVNRMPFITQTVWYLWLGSTWVRLYTGGYTAYWGRVCDRRGVFERGTPVMFSIFTIHCRVSEQYSGQVRTAPGVGMWIERYQWPGGVVLKKTKKKTSGLLLSRITISSVNMSKNTLLSLQVITWVGQCLQSMAEDKINK